MGGCRGWCGLIPIMLGSLNTTLNYFCITLWIELNLYHYVTRMNSSGGCIMPWLWGPSGHSTFHHTHTRHCAVPNWSTIPLPCPASLVIACLLHSIEAWPIHQALWQAIIPNFAPKNREISFMILIYLPPRITNGKGGIHITWSTLLGGEKTVHAFCGFFRVDNVCYLLW